MQKGNPFLLFAGVLFVMMAIILNALAYKKAAMSSPKASTKGILLSIAAGVLMSFFYRFIAASMDLSNFAAPEPLKMTPYTAFVVFAVGILASNFIFNTVMMKRPLQGPPLSYKTYFSGRLSLHLVGALGGIIWGIGNLLNLLAAGKAGPAVSYGLGQGATLIAAIWGVLIWKEFKNAKEKVSGLLAGMFACFLIGLILIIISGY
jgi:glucose uptake protein